LLGRVERPADAGVAVPVVAQHEPVLDDAGVQREPDPVGAVVAAAAQDLRAAHPAGPLRVGLEVGDHGHHRGARHRDADLRRSAVGHARSVPPAKLLTGRCSSRDRAGYQRSTNGWPVARKCPTLTHSVRPIRTRLTSGWCTCPNSAYRGWVALIASSSAVLPTSIRSATVSNSSSGRSGGMCAHSTSTGPIAATLAA